MALDYIVVGLSISVLLSYFITLFLLLEIRTRVDGKIGKAFLFLIVGVFFLILRNLEYIFFVSDLITIPYFRDYMSLFFSVLFLSAAYIFYKSVAEVTDGGRKNYGSAKKSRAKYSFMDYKRKIGKNVRY